jgi:hypothetical protein
MSDPRQPLVEPRRKQAFLDELRARARAWLPGWDLDPAASDFGVALFEIAAGFSADVAERLDRNGEKTSRGLLDWLGIEGEAARAARVPVVFKLADKTPRPVPAPAPVTLRAEAGGAAVMLETETDLTLAPARLAALVAADPSGDRFFLPSPGLATVAQATAAQDAWRTRSFAPAGATLLQLDRELELEPGMLVEVGDAQYRIVEADKDIVTLDRGLEAADGIQADSPVTRLRVFAPFGGKARDRQLHALYIGDPRLLDVASDAVIAVQGLDGVPDGIKWEYWGKGPLKPEPGWQPLDPAPGYPGVALRKQAGAIDVQTVGGVEGRWIRARLTQTPTQPLAIDQVELSVNPPPLAPKEGDPPPPPVKEVDAVANTTPQVLGDYVYPFGREPRQFDAFYLGCAEAFSKPDANVALDFTLADPSMQALTLVPGGAVRVLAGVGLDGYLHLFKVDDDKLAPLRAPVQPPDPGEQGKRGGGAPVRLDGPNATPLAARPAAWVSGGDFKVAVTAGRRVWVWHEVFVSRTPGPDSGWIDFGAVGDQADKPPIDDLVQAGDSLYALRAGVLWRRGLDSGDTWAPQKLNYAQGQDEPKLVALAPVLSSDGGRIDAANVAGLCAVADGGEAVYAGWPDVSGTVLVLERIEDLPTIDPAIRPLALAAGADRDAGKVLAIAVAPDSADPRARRLVAVMAADRNANGMRRVAGPLLGDGKIPGRDLGVGMSEGQEAVYVCTEDALFGWAPRGANVPDTTWPAELGRARGAPVVAGDRKIIVPGARGDLLIGDVITVADAANLDASRFGIAVITRPARLEDDTVALDQAGADAALVRLGATVITHGEDFVYPLSAGLSDIAGTGRLYPSSQPGAQAEREDARSMKSSDLTLKAGKLVLVRDDQGKLRENKVESVDGRRANRIVHFAADLPANKFEYWLPAPNAILSLQPVVSLDAALGKRWQAVLDSGQPVQFGGLVPDRQVASVIEKNQTWTLLLPALWQKQPTTGVHVSIEGVQLDWKRQAGDTADNPELSWEYWNGSGWWKLPITTDATVNFQLSGKLTFTVPADIAPTEWVGKKNYWIRARLVGGDYGRETVTAIAEPVPGKPEQTSQRVVRDTSGIHAPAVLELAVTYSIAPAIPASVLGEDGATIRDQSAANRVGGAAVEAFVPLATVLGRLERAQAGATAAGAAGAASSGRALYLGFDGPLQGDVLNLLFVTDAGATSGIAAPARVEVLRDRQFQPVVAIDETRGLTETGLLSISLPTAPEPDLLFGSNLRWLRVLPGAGVDQAAWSPALRGVYLNAVWARAAETQAFEMLGASNGAPFQQVQLARPPVVQGTLQLRVREPLGELERASLLADGLDTVISDGVLDGDWVLWKQVADPADWGRGDRKYALDAETGVIRFGDGLHGAIPPIGRDAIMAFSYQRTDTAGGQVPANAITAGSSLSLVTPVAGAEGALAADHAAGGTPRDDPARILLAAPARLRQRGRALTARDLEDLALGFPEVAQARALARGAATKLVLVARADDPYPSPALLREVKRALLDSAPPALAAPGAFDVTGPRLRPFQLRLTLATGTLAYAASLARSAREVLRAWFDSGNGGRAGRGWPLGARPDEAGIVARLLTLPHLDGVADVQLEQRGPDGKAGPLQALRPDDLAQLALDGITLEFRLPQETP